MLADAANGAVTTNGYLDANGSLCAPSSYLAKAPIRTRAHSVDSARVGADTAWSGARGASGAFGGARLAEGARRARPAMALASSAHASADPARRVRARAGGERRA